MVTLVGGTSELLGFGMGRMGEVDDVPVKGPAVGALATEGAD